MKQVLTFLFLGLLLFIAYFVFVNYSSNVPVFYLPWQRDIGVAVEPIPLPKVEIKTTLSEEIASDPVLQYIQVPKGFSISYFAKDVPNARSLSMNEDGIVFVGSRAEGKVYALVDSNQDYVADDVVVIAEGLNNPNGVAYKDGDLYVAEISRILVFRNIDSTFKSTPQFEVVFDKYPTDGYHGWKYIAFGPDNLLYVPVGVACNVCDLDEPYATITRLDVANPAEGYEVVARGIRNTVGFDWNPVTDVLWFADNGRDLLGDNTPPDEMNKVRELGEHFGFPFCHGKDVIDPKFGDESSCEEYSKPEVELGPHVAALGMKFYEGAQFPSEYQEKILIAEHGSWNRSEKIGYRITSVDLVDDTAENYAIFAEGWLQGEQALGRPVDVLEYTDGSILISDDMRGAVYRVEYKE